MLNETTDIKITPESQDVCRWFNLPFKTEANFWQSQIRLLSFQEQQRLSDALFENKAAD
jgi:hypothetical protein